MKQETKPLDKMSDIELTNFWNKNAEKILLGQKIVRVEYMSNAEEMDWYSRPIQILLSNGIWLTPQQDDEGNDGGSISTNTNHIIPTL
jgi:hypothetical protein